MLPLGPKKDIRSCIEVSGLRPAEVHHGAHGPASNTRQFRLACLGVRKQAAHDSRQPLRVVQAVVRADAIDRGLPVTFRLI